MIKRRLKLVLFVLFTAFYAALCLIMAIDPIGAPSPFVARCFYTVAGLAMIFLCARSCARRL